MTSTARRHVFLATATVVAALAAAFALAGLLLFARKRTGIPLLQHTISLDRVWAYATDPDVRRLVALIDAERSTSEGSTFGTIWDATDTVRLSRRLYRNVEMFGTPKYRYQPDLKKLGFYAGASGVYAAVETIDSPRVREALSGLDVRVLASASYNAAGFRVADPDVDEHCDTHVLFLGDSFTDGMWVNDTETFANQYARLVRDRLHLRLCPVNAGVNGYGSLEEAWVLEHDFDAAGAPPLVFVMHYPNDVAGLDNAIVGSGVMQTRAVWQESLGYLTRMTDFSRRRGATLIIAAIPPFEQVVDEWSEAPYQDVLRQFCEREGLQFIDLLQGIPRADAHDIYFEWDSHFTPKGHRRVAEILYEQTKPVLAALMTKGLRTKD